MYLWPAGAKSVRAFDGTPPESHFAQALRFIRGLEVPCWQVVWLAEQLEAGVCADELRWPPPG